MAAELARGVTIGAPPDPFSVQGQNWSLPAPNPLAGARDGWASLDAIYRANMRHAGMLRIDHAMGLERLFLIPEGASPAEGAYLSYPLDDLIGHIALESQRAQCMVVGEDLGTVPEGFRDRLARANILGMRVLWFERKGAEVRPPAGYPPTSVACVATHDLATLAGWWQGADIAERLSLGLLSLAKAGDQIAARREEKRGLVAALLAAGLILSAPSEDAPLSDAIAAAVHALIGGSGSILAHAQFDDLVGETVATNLPGTDRERPNWRLKAGPDVAAAFASPRAQAILAALAKGRVVAAGLRRAVRFRLPEPTPSRPRRREACIFGRDSIFTTRWAPSSVILSILQLRSRGNDINHLIYVNLIASHKPGALSRDQVPDTARRQSADRLTARDGPALLL